MKIFYPSPYKRLVWDYCNANVEAINSAIESFNWEKAFDGKDIHAQVALFNETLLNIFSNFIPNRTKTFAQSDPPWMTEDIKSKTKLKNKFYHQYMRHQTQISSLLKVEEGKKGKNRRKSRRKNRSRRKNTINVLTQN